MHPLTIRLRGAGTLSIRPLAQVAQRHRPIRARAPFGSETFLLHRLQISLKLIQHPDSAAPHPAPPSVPLRRSPGGGSPRPWSNHRPRANPTEARSRSQSTQPLGQGHGLSALSTRLKRLTHLPAIKEGSSCIADAYLVGWRSRVQAAGPGNGAWEAGGMLENLSLPVVLDSRVGSVTLRRASAEDLDSLMMLLSEDPVSAARGDVASMPVRPVSGPR